MTDIRDHAQAEMIRADEVANVAAISGEKIVTELTPYGYGFIDGAVWRDEQLPTRAEIERALIGRDFMAGATAVLDLLRR